MVEYKIGQCSVQFTNARDYNEHMINIHGVTTVRASSLLEWKIIVDQDAENYLLQSVLSKERRKDPETKAQKPEHDENGEQEIHHTTKFTRYTEKEGADDPMATEQMSTAMDGETEQETKKRMERRWEALQRKLTNKAITDMMEQGYITKEEGEVELKELERRRGAKEKPPMRQQNRRTRRGWKEDGRPFRES